jgi:anti-sigma regulatory factor (Ser/Thr protein kinase)
MVLHAGVRSGIDELMNLVVEFHSTVKSRIDALETSVDEIMKSVRQLPCATGDLDDVELALTEALANAIVHGNQQDPNKSVQICGGCERSGDLVLAITDEGAGFDHNLVPDPTSGENLLSKHGRGLLVISHVMDSMQFRLGGRQLIMRKRNQAPTDEST